MQACDGPEGNADEVRMLAFAVRGPLVKLEAPNVVAHINSSDQSSIAKVVQIAERRGGIPPANCSLNPFQRRHFTDQVANLVAVEFSGLGHSVDVANQISLGPNERLEGRLASDTGKQASRSVFGSAVALGDAMCEPCFPREILRIQAVSVQTIGKSARRSLLVPAWRAWSGGFDVL